MLRKGRARQVTQVNKLVWEWEVERRAGVDMLKMDVMMQSKRIKQREKESGLNGNGGTLGEVIMNHLTNNI